MFDVDRFIECIHRMPTLWNKAFKDYADKNIREKSWIIVGEYMFTNWKELNAADIEEKVKFMKNKWRHIRDNYVKFLNKGKNADETPKAKKYVYAEALSFLFNASLKRPTFGNIAEDGGGKKKTGRIIEEDYDDKVHITNNKAGISRRKQEVQKTRKRQAGPLNLSWFEVKRMRKLNVKKPKLFEEDADRSYLISLLPDYRKLNDDDKLDFKFMTLQFFRDIRRKNKIRTKELS